MGPTRHTLALNYPSWDGKPGWCTPKQPDHSLVLDLTGPDTCSSMHRNPSRRASVRKDEVSAIPRSFRSSQVIPDSAESSSSSSSHPNPNLRRPHQGIQTLNPFLQPCTCP
eukprot:TRINITY_DN93832_c0_g1_i1.p1 TRINITY_DN93832_c0_g1~~TRINITY_DN93832_c0_g1_i1.p1  ORF type:complete len:111 (+),score=16.57 TRINITY_DN93832_c0_g1_i1:469-801(+)